MNLLKIAPGRILRLLGRTLSDSSALSPLSSIASAMLLLIISGASAVAQPAFEVASVKPNTSGVQSGHYRFAPIFNAENVTLKSLIMTAYDVADFRVAGGPDWIDSDRYDIDAKVEGTASLDQRRQMLQALLQDRFKLVLHHETRQLPVYALVVAKNGLKLQPSKSGSCATPDPQNTAVTLGKTPDGCGLVVSMAKGQLDLANASMAALASFLSRLTGRTVVDRTGITGVFPVHLTFVPDEVASQAVDVTDGASIFTAIQDQLGLKLESSKGPVDVLVIDHTDKPSENWLCAGI